MPDPISTAVGTHLFLFQSVHFMLEMHNKDPCESANRYTVSVVFPDFLDGVPKRCIDFCSLTFLF